MWKNNKQHKEREQFEARTGIKLPIPYERIEVIRSGKIERVEEVHGSRYLVNEGGEWYLPSLSAWEEEEKEIRHHWKRGIIRIQGDLVEQFEYDESMHKCEEEIKINYRRTSNKIKLYSKLKVEGSTLGERIALERIKRGEEVGDVNVIMKLEAICLGIIEKK